jgi:hypothetical protein
MQTPCPATPARAQRPRWELADVFRQHGDVYRRDHDLPAAHRQVMHAIVVCRTASLGGHLERCDACGFDRPVYNSCRNRHCPKCQALTKARWLQARQAELLPVDYFHTVFTIPHLLNPVALGNKKVVYNILFQAAAQTLHQFAADPKHGLGGKIGFTAVLHTWDQKLLDHIHLHCLIPAGALSPDRDHWRPARPGFLFPVKALSKVFRGKFIALLTRAFHAGQLQLVAKGDAAASAEGFRQLIEPLWEKPWVVYCKPSFAGPDHVLDYLARYTHRVALANHRLVDVGNGAVSFTYRRRAGRARKATLTLNATEFIRRFLLHVLPKGYVRIRHFGFLASRSKARDLTRCQQLLGVSADAQTPPDITALQLLLELTGLDLDRCPHCKQGTMRVVAELRPHDSPYPQTGPTSPQILDSS